MLVNYRGGKHSDLSNEQLNLFRGRPEIIQSAKYFLNLILIVVCTQFAFATPDWEYTSTDFGNYSSYVGAVVLYDDVHMGDGGDQLAAFGEVGTVQGAGLQGEPPFGPYMGTTLYEIRVRSNDVGDLIKFLYYDASADVIIVLSEHYIFSVSEIF